jgi:5-formyltetrahydrofolate cyclo-ligase
MMRRDEALEARKVALRKQMARQRRLLSDALRIRAGVGIASRIAGLREFEGVQHVALFASLPDEPNTRPLFDQLRQRGCAIHFPRSPRSAAGGRLEWYRVEAWEELRAGRYGVFEPSPLREPTALTELELALIPGVAFDATGRRLGRGGGYYDRTFPTGTAGPVLVGVAFAFQLVETVPAGPLDRRVDAVVTEEAMIRVAGVGAGSTTGRGAF